MRILVTGSRGTLGIPLSAALRNVHGCDLMHCGEEHYTRADIRNYRELEHVFERAQPDVVYHLAAEFGRRNGLDHYESMWMTNVLGTRHVIELCLQYNARLIFASSSEAYGRLADTGEPLTEDLLQSTAPQFHNEYALSKWVNERQIANARERGLKAVIMRIFNVYGPGEHYTPYRSVVCRFLHAKLKGESVCVTPDAVRQLLYVDDFVRTAASIVDRFTVCEGKAINIAHPEPVKIETLARVVGAYYSLVAEPENVTVKIADTHRARVLLDHQPQVSLQEGIERTLAWMQNP